MNVMTFAEKTFRCMIFAAFLFTFSLFYSILALGLPDVYTADDTLGIFTLDTDIGPICYDDILPSSMQTDATPDRPPGTPIPEPGTIVLFITAFGMLSYGRWRRSKNVSVKTSVALSSIPVPAQHIQEERMAMVGKMTGEVIHDVKNALTGIRTCAEILRYDDSDPEERIEFAETIIGEIDRVLGMTQELLDFSYGKRRTLNIQTCSVKSSIQDILSIIACDFESRNISIRTDLRYTGEIQVDVEKMKRVFMNILTNARDAMPEGGSLTIASRLVNDMVQIDFTDTGCGMSPELQARFLEPLVTERTPHGTGLGMAIVKEILDEHHAHIDVQSIEGQGTTIRILLPSCQ